VVTSQLCYTAPHGNKETKLSHLNSHEKGCVKSSHVNTEIEIIEAQRTTRVAEETR